MKGRSYAVCNLSCSKIYIRLYDNWHLVLNNIVVNKLIKPVLCTADLLHLLVTQL